MEFELFIVDDEPGLSELIADISRDIGIKSFVFDDSLAAWEALKNQKPHALVLDLSMPNLDGKEFIQKMADEGYIDIRLVLISGGGQDALEECKNIALANSMKVVETLPKPVRLKKMYEVFHNLIGQKVAPKKASNILSFDDLSTAARVSQIAMRYQPQVSFKTGEVFGFDALMFWNHPDMGLIGPDSFRLLAERDGSIANLTKAMLEKVFIEASQVSEANQYKFSVDISSLFNLESSLPELLFLLFEANYVRSKAITLNITERVFLTHYDEVLSIWNEIDSSKYRLAVTDVGASAMSKSQLKAVPFEELRVDRRFVAKTPNDLYAMTIVEESIRLAHELGIAAVVDGIKSEELAKLMKKAGCDRCTGSFVSRPLPYEGIDNWQRNWGHEMFGKVV